jgi:hypothetical protein
VGGVGDFDDGHAVELAACWAAAVQLVPATRTWMSPPIFWAAVTVLRVAALRLWWSCSAITRRS